MKTFLVTLVILAAMSAAAWFLFQRFVALHSEAVPRRIDAPSQVSAGVKPPPPEVLAARILNVSGQVESDRNGSGWTPVLEGAELKLDESLRTSPGAHADLALGSMVRVAVDEGSEVKIRELTHAVQRLHLKRGRASVENMRGGERMLRVEDDSGESAAEVREEARFDVLASGDGLTVATTTGSVNLRAHGEAVLVTAGLQSSADDLGGLSAPIPIPKSVLMKIAAHAARGNAALCARIQGTVNPGSEVRVDDVLASVDLKGRFAMEVRRRPNVDKVRISTRDVHGERSEESVRCAPKLAPTEIRRLKIDWHAQAPAQ